LRNRAAFLVKGVDPGVLMAGVYGKATGPSKGKISSHHMGDLNLGILAGSTVIGSQFPTAAGAALAFKLKKTDQVCLCYFGDGASNRGDFHEGLNLASIFKLPVIFICENNQYAVSMPTCRSMAIQDISSRAQGYGMPGITIDGNDVLAVYESTKEAIERGRRGKGPTLVECKTYRLRVHSERRKVDPRPKEEIETWRQKCPIKRLKQKLLEEKILSEASAQKIEQECQEIIDRAVKFAEESPYPQPEEALNDVYTVGHIKGGRLCLQ
jgi:pyruvate dehydrogenase E1 component alpha subunit